MNPKDDQGHGPFVMERMELKPHLRLQLAGAEEGEVIRSDEEMVDIQQAKHAAESAGGVHQLAPRGKQGQRSVDRGEQDIERPGNNDVTDEADDVTEYGDSKEARVGGDVLHGLSGVVRSHQLRVNGKLSVADRIEQVGEAGDQRRLTQGNAIVGFLLRIPASLACSLRRVCGEWSFG